LWAHAAVTATTTASAALVNQRMLTSRSAARIRLARRR
jgi:hypothetical protein